MENGACKGTGRHVTTGYYSLDGSKAFGLCPNCLTTLELDKKTHRLPSHVGGLR